MIFKVPSNQTTLWCHVQEKQWISPLHSLSNVLIPDLSHLTPKALFVFSNEVGVSMEIILIVKHIESFA